MEAADKQANVIEGSRSINASNNDPQQVCQVTHKNFMPRDNQRKPSFPQAENKPVKTCTRCGNRNHAFWELDKCPANSQKCTACGIPGHFKQYCKTKKHVYTATEWSEPDTPHSNPPSEYVHQGHKVTQDFAFRVNSVGENIKRILLDVKVNGKPVEMQLDTAADVTIVSEEVARSIPNLMINECHKDLRDYNHKSIVLE
ncbi:hypothetical protein GWK47_054737 [Chionoecetes opilio]|uniref:CCHC-type domain-containing protein n=1 Tax=Chionoecetes opilio TaxID=41210 RepID=A0A8J4Y6R4_CHIOP|nr:hypothetical protein GWK47_054737 [Chionoecetes opilio]